MIFTSFEFLVFFSVVLVALAGLRAEGQRRWLLLVASYLFYGWWDWRFCFLLLGSSLVDYVVALRIAASPEVRIRRRWLAVSLAANLGVLGFFKYANFFLDSVRALFAEANVRMPDHLGIILPVGISFFTFQTMSYTIDVYRGRLAATRSFRDFALFVSFFPQLVAGPIVRGSEFLPQLDRIHTLRGQNLRKGVELFLVGFVKKTLFADRLAIYVDRVFDNPALYSSGTCWVALLAYAAQIYYDFSGYTDMAIGVGRALGFEFPENFRHPYLSRSISEFWRRWHISLSRWLRDFLYIPLGGNRRGLQRTYVNLIITMLLGGLWHGASWNFVVWGGLHGIALAFHRIVRGHRRYEVADSLLGQTASWLSTLLFVLFCWVFFRASDLGVACLYLGRLLDWGSPGISWFYAHAVVILCVSALLHLGTSIRAERPWRLRLQGPYAWAILAASLAVMLYLMPTGPSPFIYFQF